ncbi:oligosaccharide flippase family protein [Heyndrickxia ginsengihumi]|uniref:oligosaccharide flippase family protein n=1 Tax=Heyndrickxia ginsengihumi TaxID=363870 RepID=UPI003D1DF22B
MKNSFLNKLVGFSIGPIVGAFISFITIPVTTYFVNPAEYGKASMFSLLQVLVATFIFLGFDQAYTREYHEAKDKLSLIKNALFFPLTIAILLLFVICANLNFVSNILFGATHFHLAAILFGITILLLVIERFILLSIRMNEKAIEYSVVNILMKTSILIFTILFLNYIRKDFLAVVYSSVIGQFVGDIYLIIRYRKFLNYFRYKFDGSVIIKMFLFGLPLIFSASLNSLLNSLDRIFLRSFSNFTEVGIFTAAQKVSAALTIIQSSFTSFWVPTAYRWNSENKDIKYFEIVSEVLLLIMSILFTFILIFKDIITYLLSSNYTSSALIIGLLCLQPIMYTISETTTLGIVFSRRSYLNIFVSVISVIPNIVLNIILVPKYGANGAAIATAVSYIFFFLSRSFFSNKYWEGFSLRIHLIVTVVMFISALINVFIHKNIIYINLITLIIIVALQIGTFNKLHKIRGKKNKEKWDFS